MEVPKTFEELQISSDLKKAMRELGYSELFPIQAQTIPKILAGNDIVGQAQTGTGKTAAFGIPIIERIDLDNPFIQAIILVPTRELAIQLCNELKIISKYKKVSILAVYGGASIENQIDTLRRGVHVVVGTPGRIIDHLGRGTLRLSRIKIVVLDEADRMLDMGFIDDIRFILEGTPRDRQTLLFSATMPESILFLAQKYMKAHEVIAVSKDEITVKDTEQVYCDVNYFNKVATLKKILTVEKIDSAIIFCNTKAGVDKLVHTLQQVGHRVEAIHGNLTQSKRNRVMTDFRSGKFKLLVATDVAARGLDIKGVSHVINYNVPNEPTAYVHRIGRTGRAGETGKAITFVTERDREAFGSIEWFTNMKIKKVDYGIPEGDAKQHSESRHQGGDSRHPRQHSQHKKHFEHRSNRPNRYALGEF
jgi:ATP-dependent RNA helicase DeaD